jgi:hypothetical protein
MAATMAKGMAIQTHIGIPLGAAGDGGAKNPPCGGSGAAQTCGVAAEGPVAKFPGPLAETGLWEDSGEESGTSSAATGASDTSTSNPDVAGGVTTLTAWHAGHLTLRPVISSLS